MMDKVTKIYTKVARAGVTFPAMRRVVSLLCALTAALVIGLAGTDAAQAVSVGPNVTLSLTTADCTYPGQISVHYGFYPAYGGSYYVSIRLWMRNVTTGRWTYFPWSQPALVTPGQKLNLSFWGIPDGLYQLRTEWEQYQGNYWSQSIYDNVDQVFNWLPNGWSQNSNSLCAL
jgi:hypothetical protein